MICYQGPKKPQPPKITLAEGESYNRTVKKMKSIEHAVQNDIGWLVIIIKSNKEGNTGVEWSGYMASIAHQQDIPLNATKYIFDPLINETPSHPDTVLTTMLVHEKFTAEHGQIYSYLEADMQLYKVAIHIKWSDTGRWKHMIIRPGGMYTLMSFIGCIGTLMSGTGLQKVLGAAFKGVPNMINGKVWPKALQGMRMIVTVMMEELVEVANYDVEQIQVCLEKATEHPNGRL